MDRNTLWRLGTAFPLVLSCIVLADCGGTNGTTTTPFPPTAIAAKRYVEGGTFDAGFSGGAVATKIDASEFEYALAVALQSGKIIAAGHSVLAGQGVIALVRYNADGSLDTGFGSSGIVRTAVPSVNAVATAVVVQPGLLPADDKILVAGSTFVPSTATAGIVLARYSTNGTLDTGFAGGQGFVSAAIGPGTSVDNASLALQGASIVVAGATTAGDFVLRRYDSTGVLDQAFGTNGTTTTHVGTSAMGPAIALQSDGKIVAAGASGSIASPPMNAVLVRYGTNGILDMSFGGAGTGMVFTDIGSSNNFANAVAVQTPDDKIVVAGHAFFDLDADTSDITLLRYNANGTPDTGFGTNGTGAVVTDLGAFDNALYVALYPDPDNRIVVSGNTGSGIAISSAVLRFTPGGALDPTFGTGGIVTTAPKGPSIAASANAVLVQPDRSIVVVGYD
jgi:uncharacterized delta-60 repeat protein